MFSKNSTMGVENFLRVLVPAFFIAGFFILGSSAKADGLTILQDTTWRAGQPVVIDEKWDGLVIAAGATLTIKAGTVVKLGEFTNINVYGRLEVQGTPDNPVIITSLGDSNSDVGFYSLEPGDWGKIKTYGASAQVDIDYAEIKHGGGEMIFLCFAGSPLPAASTGGRIKITHSNLLDNNDLFSLDASTLLQINFSNIYNPHFCYDQYDDDGDPTGARYCGSTIENRGGTIFDLTNNYWGSPFGPTQIITEDDWNKPLLGTHIFGPADYLPFLTTPWQPAPPAPKRNPVIIVPGIIASYLKNAASNEEIWPNFGDANLQCINSCQSFACKVACLRNCVGGMNNMLCSPSDNFLDQLILNDDGSQDNNNSIIKSTDIFRTITDQNFYAGLVQELENNGYKENQDLFVFPYDWRLNIDWIADNNPMPFSLMQTLKQKIAEVKTKTGAEKVDIIAHSLGGLVVKDYIQKNGTSSIDKFIDIATPHLGSPLAFKILNYGDNLDICIGEGKNKFCFLNVGESKEMSQNMPSVYQLLPSRKYFASTIFDQFSTGNYIYDIVGGNQNVGILSPLDYDQSINFLATQKDEKKETRNQFLLGYFGINAVNVNDELHSRLDNPTSSDKYYNIIGCGQATFAGIKKWDNGFKVLPPIDGDNTVPFKSAAAFANVNHQYYAKAKHSLIPSVNGVRQLVASILQGTENNFNFSAYQDLKQNDSICGINGAQIGALSPVELHAYDENGNHTGPLENGDIEESIPGSSYDVFGKDQYIFLPAGHNYHIVNQATSSGELGITIDEIKNSQPTKFVYFDSIPLSSASTTVEYNIVDDQTQYEAGIDSDGDKTIDQAVAPDSILTGEQMNDLAAPQTTINISGQSGNNNYYISNVKVDLSAGDDDSGVLKTEYSLDGGKTWIKYEGEFTIFQDGTATILYSSTDRAGNREENKTATVKIDQIKPTINILLPQEGQEVLRSDTLDVEYFATDDISGIATATAKIYFDVSPVNSNKIDLFGQTLGQHKVKITIQDLAGNQKEQTANFSLITDIDGTIADVNRAYDEKMIIKIEAKKDLGNDLTEIKNFQEKYGQRIDKEKAMRDKAMAQCLKHKDQAWCEKKIGARFDRFEYRLSKISQAVIKIKYNLILAKLDMYLRIKWINQAGYTIIKEDIKYLINKI